MTTKSEEGFSPPDGTICAGYISALMNDFGFIVSQGSEFFFHESAVKGGRDAFDELFQGDRVQFTVVNAPKGKRAVGVEKVGE